MSALNHLTVSLRDAINKTWEVWITLLCLLCRTSMLDKWQFWRWITLSDTECELKTMQTTQFALNLNNSDIKTQTSEWSHKVSLWATIRTAAGSSGLMLSSECVHMSQSSASLSLSILSSNSKRFTRAKAKQTLILHVALVEGEDVLLWEPRTRWNNKPPASCGNFIFEIVLRLRSPQCCKTIRGNRQQRIGIQSLEQPRRQWFPRGERGDSVPRIRFSLSLQISFRKNKFLRKQPKNGKVNQTKKKVKWSKTASKGLLIMDTRHPQRRHTPPPPINMDVVPAAMTLLEPYEHKDTLLGITAIF